MRIKNKGYTINTRVIPFLDNYWTFYPITYRNKQYVIVIEGVDSCGLGCSLIDIPICYIYEYGNKRKLFRKHKRKKVAEFEIPYIRINDSLALNTEDIELNDIIKYIPEVMSYIFKRFERYKAEKLKVDAERKRIIEKSKTWNRNIK